MKLFIGEEGDNAMVGSSGESHNSDSKENQVSSVYNKFNPKKVNYDRFCLFANHRHNKHKIQLAFAMSRVSYVYC